MAEIRPFRGVRYNSRKIKDLSRVICPPYDIISTQRQNELYQSCEYNFVRIEYNRELPQDNSQDNRYTRAANTLADWLKQGILEFEPVPAIYLHRHHFSVQGQQFQRYDISACVRLEEWDKRVILPHENIIPKAKSDRMSMLYACESNTSAVLAMYQDPQKVITSLFKIVEKDPPVIDSPDSWGDWHQVWAVSQPEIIRKIQEVISGQPLYIADGHHRYDSALTYRRERLAQSTAPTGEEGFNFVMMSLIDFVDPGLVILPTHRLVRGIPRSILRDLKSRLKVFFDIEEIALDSSDIGEGVDRWLNSRDNQKTGLAVYGLEGDKAFGLTLRNQKDAERLMPAFHGELYRKLDVSLVDHVILEKLLAYNKDKEEIILSYDHDRQDVINRVKSQEYQLAFILNPVSPETIKGIADTGDRMPRKSTYFYPKAPAGLVFYKW